MSKARQNSNIPNRLTVADRTTLQARSGIKEGEMVVQEDIGLTYTWSTDNTLVDNGGTIIAATGGFWVAHHDGRLNVKWFGAVGDGVSDDTVGFDLAFAEIDRLGYSDVPSINGARNVMLVSDAPTLYIPKGSYLYNGAGYTPINQKVIIIEGSAASAITIQSDVHLILIQNSSRVISYVNISKIKTIGGRGLYFNTKTDIGSVQQSRRFNEVVCVGYTSVAIGSIADSDARWELSNLILEGGDTGTPVGLYLPDELAELSVAGQSTIVGNTYNIILNNTGMSEMYINGAISMFNISGRTTFADVWIQPGGNNHMFGVTFSGFRFSNENFNPDKPNFLIADRDNTTANYVFTHSTSISTNSAVGMTIRNCTLNAANNAATPTVGYILSYTPKVSGLLVEGNLLGQYRDYILQYADGITATDVDKEGASTNIFKLTSLTSKLNAYKVKDITNIRGAGLTFCDEGYLGYSGQYISSSDGAAGYSLVHNTSNTRNLSRGANVSQLDILDSAGGLTGSTFTFGANEQVVFPFVYGNIRAGEILFVEFEAKKSNSTPLEKVHLYTATYNASQYRGIVLTNYWQRFVIPITIASSPASGSDLSISIRPSLFLNVGVTDSFDMGRIAMYNADGVLPYSLTAI